MSEVAGGAVAAEQDEDAAERSPFFKCWIKRKLFPINSTTPPNPGRNTLQRKQADASPMCMTGMAALAGDPRTTRSGDMSGFSGCSALSQLMRPISTVD